MKYSLPPPQLQGCALSNAAGLLVAALAFCLYCYGLSITSKERCGDNWQPRSRYNHYRCPFDVLSVSLLQVTMVMVMKCVLSQQK